MHRNCSIKNIQIESGYAWGVELWQVWFLKVLHLSWINWSGYKMVMLHFKQDISEHSAVLQELVFFNYCDIVHCACKLNTARRTKTLHFLQGWCVSFKECILLLFSMVFLQYALSTPHGYPFWKNTQISSNFTGWYMVSLLRGTMVSNKNGQ